MVDYGFENITVHFNLPQNTGVINTEEVRMSQAQKDCKYIRELSQYASFIVLLIIIC